MKSTGRNAKIVIGGCIFAAFLAVVAVKILYIGVRETSMGNVGANKIVFCWTLNSWGSLISKDGRTGFYRIYDKDGRKVFELFSDGYAFDIVLGGDKRAEFQLDSGETKYWSPPK